MAKAFSVMSWNVEHFGARKNKLTQPTKPVKPIIEQIAAQDPDVLGIYEVVGSVVFDTIVDEMPGHNFYITEGEQVQEILIGVRKNMNSFITQKLEFKSGQSTLRPGVLLTMIVDGEKYPMLFLHLKSLTPPKGFGLRDDMLERALKFRKVLEDSANGATANYMFLGDLNTMGMKLTYSNKDISAEEEITRLEKRGHPKDLRILKKTHPSTWWPGSSGTYEPGNLDHVVAADHLTFKQFSGADVKVSGWVDETTNAKRTAWTKKYSDHSWMYFEVQKV